MPAMCVHTSGQYLRPEESNKLEPRDWQEEELNFIPDLWVYIYQFMSNQDDLMEYDINYNSANLFTLK